MRAKGIARAENLKRIFGTYTKETFNLSVSVEWYDGSHGHS